MDYHNTEISLTNDGSAMSAEFDKLVSGLTNRLRIIESKFESPKQQHLFEVKFKNSIEEWAVWEEEEKKLLIELQTLGEEIKKSEKISDQYKTYLMLQKSNCEEIKNEVSHFIKRNEELDQQLKLIKQKTEIMKQDINTSKKSTEERLGAFEKAVGQYKEALGLCIKFCNDKLIFVFKNIDANSPDRQFSYFLKVNSENLYEVYDCKPQIPDVDNMVKKLNETNNLPGFTIAMRKKFKAEAC